jgi:hypothetical protein
VLKPEVARQRLEQWTVSTIDADADGSALLPAVSRLPRPLRPVGYALFNRDGSGKELGWNDWEAKQRQRNETLANWTACQAAGEWNSFRSSFRGWAARSSWPGNC